MSKSVMIGISTPQTKNPEPSKLSTQVTNKNEKILEKEKHQLIYRAFLDTLENPEKQTQQEMEEIAKKLKEKLSKEQEQKLLGNLKSLKELLNRLKNEDEKEIFTFVLENSGRIFNDVNPKIKPLSEENFSQFLLSVFKEIREKNLASKENLENNKIEKIVDECVVDIRGKEAWHQFTDFAKHWIPGRGLLEKIPGLEKVLSVEKKEDEPPLSDEEMVTTFLRKSLLPFIAFTATILFIGSTSLFGIPPFVTIGLAVLCLATAEYSAIKSLFSNNRKGTLYNPDTEKKKEWGGEIISRISEILKSKVNGIDKGEQPGEQLTQGRENNKQPAAALGRVNVDQPNGSKSPVNTP